MLAKYVERRFPTYFDFGGSKGRVNICSLDRDDIVLCTPGEAKVLIEDRDKIVSYLASMADAFDKAAPEHFSHFWYGSEAPKEDYATLKAQRDELLAACKEFVRKCDAGEARSNRSYAQMAAAIAKCEVPV